MKKNRRISRYTPSNAVHEPVVTNAQDIYPEPEHFQLPAVLAYGFVTLVILVALASLLASVLHGT